MGELLDKISILEIKKKIQNLLGSRNNNNFIAERITKCDSVPLDVSNINSVKM